MKFHHTTISVKNLEISIKFYVDILGFSISKRFERADLGGKAAFLSLGDTRLELWEFDIQIPSTDDFNNLNILGYKHIGLEVDNIQTAHENLKNKSVDIGEIQKGATARYAFLKDPDGLPIELYEPYIS